ncbi:hypothetical protein GBA52_013374 [Prunus armeniaca]|nr:hypothetical protein GBA52_013374 [Prunus armeniaca]
MAQNANLRDLFSLWVPHSVPPIPPIDELEGEIGDALRVALKGLGTGNGGSGGGRVIGEGERIGGIDW